MREARSSAVSILATCTLAACTLAGVPGRRASAQAQAPAAASPAIRTGTRLVVVDVVVEDAEGHPVHGLQRDDFSLTEKKQPQTLRHFEEHSTTAPPKPGPPFPPLPAGQFTDYTPTPPSGALNVLLLDALNTPMTDQAYVRYQLQRFVKKAPPGMRIAIFGLGQRLYMLQGFTSDPATLRDVVEHKLVPRASHLLDDPAGTGAQPPQMSGMATDMATNAPAMAQVASSLQQFEAETNSFQTRMRVQYTMDAFNTLAHYLSAFPGRKNLIWFSGAFPINIPPDPNLSNPFGVMESTDAEFRETTNLMTQSQVAVYPVDARGLMTDPAFSAANRGTTDPRAFTRAIGRFAQSQADEHSTMQQLADATGGHAFYNTNDLTGAVEHAIEAGSNFYTLAYTPADSNFHGEYRPIRVTLSPRLANAGYKLAYRQGYYTDQPVPPKRGVDPAASAPPPTAGATTASTTPGQQESLTRGILYQRAAMLHGAPAPEEILFKVRILPAVRGTEETLAPENIADPAHPIQPPFRRFAVDFATFTNQFKLTLMPDGTHAGEVEFEALVYDADGKLLNIANKDVRLNLKPDTFKAFANGRAAAHLEISAPAKGATFLRVGIHDRMANRFGVVEIPLATVANLTPVAELPPEAPATTGQPAPVSTGRTPAH